MHARICVEKIEGKKIQLPFKNCYFYIRVINVSKTLDTQPKISKIQYSNLYIVNGNVSKKLFLYLFLVP